MREIISKEIMETDYARLNLTEMSKKYNVSKRYLINRAYNLGIKWIKRRNRFCLACKIQIDTYSKKHKGLCRTCAAKNTYSKRGKFTNKSGKLFSNEEMSFLLKNYYGMTKKELCFNLNRSWCSISHKAIRLKLKRNPKFIEEGNKLGREYFKVNNPMKNEEIKHKALKKAREVQCNRNFMTKPEKIISNLLQELNIQYEWNKPIRTFKTTRFPDFKIDNLIIEVDGIYWHKDKQEEDKARQIELEQLGYKIIRFSDIEIINNLTGVSQCIQQQLLSQ